VSNTITLPEETNAAKQALDQLLVDPAKAIYLFLFGDSQQVKAFAVIADAACGGALCKVVRRSRFNDLLDRFKELAIDPGLPSLSSPDVIGFSTSGHLIISDVVRSGDTLNAMRAADALTLAEGHA